MKHKIGLFILILGLCLQLYGQPTTKHEIVFVIPTQYINTNTDWLTSIVNGFSATGVCLSLNWYEIQTSYSSSYNYSNYIFTGTIQTAINLIDQYNDNHPNAKLDIYFRVNMGTGKPNWVAPTDQAMSGGTQDFQVTSDGAIYDYYNYEAYNPNDATMPRRRHPLNFASNRSKQIMMDYYHAVLDYIGTLQPDIKAQIVEVSPTFSHYEETEYPIHRMCGYSTPEIIAFKAYLKTKYNSSISLLNQKWGSSFSNPSNSDWSDLGVNPRNYNWDTKSNMQYSKGRADWIDFRTTQLANFLSEFEVLNSTHRTNTSLSLPKFGVQFGSIYDSGIENRGWVDPTKIIESADVVHVADTPTLKDNFDFGADYLRSICKFWSKTTTAKPRSFTTESNALEIDNGELTTTVSNAWIKQIDDYEQKGVDAYFLCNWEYDPQTIFGFTEKTSFNAFRNRLATFKANTPTNQFTQNNTNTTAIHIGCEYFMYDANNDTTTSAGTNEFKLQLFSKAQSPYLTLATYNWNDDSLKDIVTNYMIERNPTYINNYTSGLNFTRTSQFITENAYVYLMKSEITVTYLNQTWWSHNGHGEYAFTHGIKNQYNQLRSPSLLIWRSRNGTYPDLMSLYPSAGKNDDFIYWAYNYGCGHIDGTDNYREYPFWEVKDANGRWKFDTQIYNSWTNNTGNVQTTYPNGYTTNPVSSSNMITWAVSNISGYSGWPYIGTAAYKKSENTYTEELPKEFSLSQNYPNPFNPTTVISYSVPSANIVTLKVYDVLGREVSTLENGVKEAGNYEVQFDASKLASGLYIYTLKSHNSNISKKMLLLK